MDKQKFREIQILLDKRSSSSNKEIQRILRDVPGCPTLESILDTFGRLFGLAKYSNREMLYFLNVFLRFISMDRFAMGEIGEKIVGLKFMPSEKDTDSAILKYFEVVNHIADEISEDASRSVLSRYTFMLCNDVVGKAVFSEVFRRFSEFLRKKEGFLRMFIGRGMYKDICYREEFVVDFCGMFSDEEAVDAALECETLRGFMTDHTRSKYLFQMYHSTLPKWYLSGLHASILPYLYYVFDRTGMYKDVSRDLYREIDVSELAGIIERDLDGDVEDCDIKPVGHELGHGDVLSHECEDTDRYLIGIRRDIETFNETGTPQHIFGRFNKSLGLMLLRYSEDTDLKQLGTFLCKLKNEAELKIFTGTFDFSDMDLLQGLRTYLSSFHLLGEGQIIHRVVEAYADKYYRDNASVCTFMNVSKDERTREFIFNLSFSFLVLNTKFHNANVKVKPSFRDYMKDFTSEEIPESFSEEYLESMFVSIKKRPLEYPTKNRVSREHYRLYRRVCRELAGWDSGMDRSVLSTEFPEKLNICSLCRLKAHRRLFSSDFSRFLSLDPGTFYSICDRLRLSHPFEEYLAASKDDTHKFIKSFTYYLRMGGRVELYVMLFDVLLRIEKRRNTGVFSDLSISFLKGGLSRKERILPQYKDVYSELVDAEVSDIGLVCNALRQYLQSPEQGEDSSADDERDVQSRKGKKSVSFVTGVVIDILERNIERLDDLSMLNDESLGVLLEKCVLAGNQRKFCQVCRFMSSSGLLAMFKKVFDESPDFVNDEVVAEFKRIPVDNSDGFHCVLFLQNNGIDMFDFVVSVKYETIICRAINAGEVEGDRIEDIVSSEDQSRLSFGDKDTLNCYSIEERYEDCLKMPSNLFRFYVSSNSILNQSRARSIHKSGCPLSQPLFGADEMDRRLIYMVKKADVMNNKDITNYTLWIVNLLSSSLPLLTKFFVRNFGLLLTLKDQAMLGNFIKIFYSRVCKTMTGSCLCCGCGYSSLGDVETFMELLFKYDLSTKKDFEFYFNGRSELMGQGRIKYREGDLVLEDDVRAGEGADAAFDGKTGETGAEDGLDRAETGRSDFYL